MVAMFLAGALALPVLAAPKIGFEKNGLTAAIAEGGGYDKGVNEYTLSQSIGQVIKVILSLVGTIFFVLTIYAGFLWMTASGNDEQVTKATDILKAAAIGIVITMAAYGITAFVVIYTNTSTGGAQDGYCLVFDNRAARTTPPECISNTKQNACKSKVKNDVISSVSVSWVAGDGKCP